MYSPQYTAWHTVGTQQMFEVTAVTVVCPLLVMQKIMQCFSSLLDSLLYQQDSPVK